MKKRCCLTGVNFLLLLALAGPVNAVDFRRGDSNADARIDVTDAVHTLFHLFLRGSAPSCLDAADSDDNESLNIADPTWTLRYLFLGQAPMPAPGPLNCGPDPAGATLGCDAYYACPADGDLLERVGHLLNRAAYGPSLPDVDRVLQIGIDPWIEEQLNPASLDDSALAPRVAPLMETVVRSDDLPILSEGALWRYHKGSTAPLAGWRTAGFDDSGWPEGPSGFGYDDGDDATELLDMQTIAGVQPGYMCLFIRRKFTVADPAAIRTLILSVNYDDGFVAWVNGFEVARRNMPGAAGTIPAFNASALTLHVDPVLEAIDISAHRARLQPGENVIAIQGANVPNSGDFSLIPEILDRREIPGGTSIEIRGINELRSLAQVYSIYSRRQLQAVLGEFWENHFTTDYDKVAEYLDALENSDATDALSAMEAGKEAARLDHAEFEFFRGHALGNFGDLLRFSARSPTMLIYLDNVLNVRGNANENYAREILELHAFGADNGYVQTDIEQLAKCFTGWGICKVAPENLGVPDAPCGVQVADTPIMSTGAFNPTMNPTGGNWRYFKGTVEPPAGWKDRVFDDSAWLQGPGGIGYGDNDDATTLTDMFNGYTTVYMRRSFNIADPEAMENFIFSIDVDDGFVAYLNGTEVARYYAPGAVGAPVPFGATATQLHDAGVPLNYNLNRRRGLLIPASQGQNVLAVHALNYARDSSDLSSSVELINRRILPGSIENGSQNGVWSFRFFPALHNSTDTKTMFSGAYRLVVPPRTGPAGVQEADSAIARILDHPSTSTFICSKLIQRFVGDEIDFRNPAQSPYSALLARCVTAWNSPAPKGDIGRVMRAILTSPEFWSDRARRSKVKTGFEYIASTSRVLGAENKVDSTVVGYLSNMGMELFIRDEPDGWPEVGGELIDTSTLLSRMKFAQTLSESTAASSPNLYWNAAAFLTAQGLDTADEVVEFFDRLLFQGTLTAADRAIVREYLTTDDTYQNQVPLTVMQVQRALGLMLSFPQWQFQ